MITFVWCAASALYLVAAPMLVYWHRDRSARRRYFRAALAAQGVAIGLQSLAYYLTHSSGWYVWGFAGLAVVMISSVIWDARKGVAGSRHA